MGAFDRVRYCRYIYVQAEKAIKQIVLNNKQCYVYYPGIQTIYHGIVSLFPRKKRLITHNVQIGEVSEMSIYLVFDYN